MPKNIYTHEPTWLDGQFKKSFKKLSRKDQELCNQRLDELVEALESCNHPALDPALQRWRPSAYRSIAGIAGNFVEYRFSGTMRVITCYFESEPGQIDDEILLIAITLNHDHDRIQRLISGHKASIKAKSRP